MQTTFLCCFFLLFAVSLSELTSGQRHGGGGHGRGHGGGHGGHRGKRSVEAHHHHSLHLSTAFQSLVDTFTEDCLKTLVCQFGVEKGSEFGHFGEMVSEYFRKGEATIPELSAFKGIYDKGHELAEISLCRKNFTLCPLNDEELISKAKDLCR